MHIAHLNSYLKGGAAIAVQRLHESLLHHGIESIFYHLQGKTSKKTYVSLEKPHPSALIARLYKKIQKHYYFRHSNHYVGGGELPERYEQFGHTQFFETRTLSQLQTIPDILHLHWISMLLDYPSFFASIPNSLPIVWTLHDMNPLTGGCHYSWGCEHYTSECSDCPQLRHSSTPDLSQKNFSLKKQIFKNKNVHIVADSYWLESTARLSPIFSSAKSFQTIHYGLDTKAFSPGKKKICKAALGLNPSSFVIGFGANEVKQERKGFHKLNKALSYINKPNNILLLLFGSGELMGEPEGVPLKHLGFVESPTLLSLIYSASDIFVIPSLYEAFGQTALEAMACGTPTIGFDTGGISDMIIPGETGLLAKTQDSEDLAQQIQWMLAHPEERKKMEKIAPKLVEQKFTRERQAEQYISLYRRLLESSE